MRERLRCKTRIKYSKIFINVLTEVSVPAVKVGGVKEQIFVGNHIPLLPFLTGSL